ncbi:MAG: epimerase [Spirochaetes bacterium GWF1_41_5]|nr:MAG: epimerase [Spirochaetes bacterium GWF1_41_5]HBE01218.1 epimerase [Spirochaetia bacterium]
MTAKTEAVYSDQKKTILITGGAGFIGSHLCDRLIAENHRIICLDNLSLGIKDNIRHLFGHDSFTFIKTDLCAFGKLQNIFKKYTPDTVFHLAANSDIQKGALVRDVDLKNTFLSTYNVLEAMAQSTCKKIVFASTSAVYGELKSKLHENIGPLFPISFYGSAKLASEAYISAYCENLNLQAWIFRFPNVVGERCTHGAVYDFIGKLRKNPTELIVLGNGTQCKPYLYVKDLIDGILFGFTNSCGKINYFNLGVNSATTVDTIARIVIEEMGLAGVNIRHTGGDRGWVGDVPVFSYDLSKIHELGWHAGLDSDSSVRCAVRAELARKK